MIGSTKKVMVAMSGGVDSSVAAALLLEQGYACSGVFVRMLSPELGIAKDLKGQLADAQNVCKHLGIELHIVDYSWDMQQIINYFAREYAQGRTPNPCVKCNARLKFSKLLAFARSMGARYLATGHYARIVESEGLPRLARGLAKGKDQSYVLFGIRRAELGSILFPNGEAQSKDEIRKKAKDLNLPVFDKGDSQEICFVPEDDYAKFLTQFHPELDQPGPILDMEGKIIGEHKGVFRYTIGQRRGLRVAAGEPRYVVRIDPNANQVTLGQREDLARNTLYANELNWHIDPPTGPIEVLAQIRYAHKATHATVERVDADRVLVKFVQPEYAVTPGQAVVFYDHDIVIGGGWISSDEPQI
jgi:tRNA-specific 2-thiouridylase